MTKSQRQEQDEQHNGEARTAISNGIVGLAWASKR